MQNNYILQNSLDDYIKFTTNKDNYTQVENKIKVMVNIELNLNDLKNINKPFDMNDIQHLANVKYETIYKRIENSMIEYQKNLNCDNVILVEVHEIGIDKANDIAFISHITNNSRQEYFIDGLRIKYEYAIALAISMCIILKAKKVYYIRNEDFKWK